MKLPITLVLSAALFACEPATDNAVVDVSSEETEDNGTANFRVRNGEIRDDMIRMLDEAGIEFSLADDGAIIYNLSDGETIDKIGNEAISEYITRN